MLLCPEEQKMVTDREGFSPEGDYVLSCLALFFPRKRYQMNRNINDNYRKCELALPTGKIRSALTAFF